MSNATTFDTLGYFEKLKAAGVPEAQAKAHADAMREVIEDRLATKRDLADLRNELNGDMRELEARLTVNLTNRFGVMLAAAVAVLAVLIKIL